MIVRFADHHDTKYNKKADPGDESQGRCEHRNGYCQDWSYGSAGWYSESIVKVDLEDTPDEVDEEWKRKLLEAHADTQKYSWAWTLLSSRRIAFVVRLGRR